MTTTSVAMATYRGERWLQRQLTSILQQTTPVEEIVITDDSPDGKTAELAAATLRGSSVEHRIERNDRRLGPARNFERAMSLCRGDVIFLADQDDEWKPHKVQQVLQHLDQHRHLDAVFTDADIESTDRSHAGCTLWELTGFERFRGDYAKDPLGVHLRTTIVTGATMAIRARALPLVLPVSPDALHDAWFGTVLAALGTIGPLDERLMTYHLHGGNVAGVPPTSLREQLRQRLALPENEERLVRFHEQVLQRVGPLASEDARERIRGKIHHASRRMRLPRNPLRRTSSVGLAVLRGEYSRYSASWKGPVYDVLFGGRRSAAGE